MTNLVANLDAAVSDEVGSAQKLSVLTGEADIWLFVYSGFAKISLWAAADVFSGGADAEATIRIKLDNISGILLQFATTASLADIYLGDSPSETLSVNSASLALEENGDLILTNQLTAIVTDGHEELSSYAYYVSAKILLKSATISGTIRWKKTLAKPHPAPHFLITANTPVSPPPGQLGPSTAVEATGSEGTLDASDNTYFYVPYTITGALLGKNISVLVDPIGAGFYDAPSNGSLYTKQISGPTSIHLTTSHFTATNVDFEMLFDAAPK